MLQNSDETISVAVAQTDVEIGNCEKNLNTIANMVLEASSHGVKLVVFPELIDRGYDMEEYRHAGTFPYDDSFSKLHKLAVDNDVAIIWGNSYFDTHSCKNSQFITTNSIPPRPVYFKQNLFPGEETAFKHGDENSRFAFGEYELGFQICYDIRFPESLRSYLPKMPQIIIVSAAWPLARIAHWENLLIARAIENQCFIVASNRVGVDSGLVFGGTSLIISPYGEILQKAGESETEIIIHSLDLQDLENYRRTFPVLQ